MGSLKVGVKLFASVIVTSLITVLIAVLGYVSLRPNFRGVGASAGTHDDGRGECEDMLTVLAQAQQGFGELPVALAGFSFGAYVQTRDQTIHGLRNYAELVFDSMNDSIIVLSPELRIESCNRCCAELLGEDSHALLGRPLAAVLHADGLEEAIHAVLHGAPALDNQIFTLRLVHDDCRHKARITLKRVCLGDELGRALLVLDRINEEESARLEAEEKLASSEALLRQAQAAARIGSWRIEPGGLDPEALEWSAETYRLFGVPPGTRMTYPDFLDRIYP